MQRFNIKTNHVCNISWFLDGELKAPEINVNNSSYYDGSLTPGFYNVSILAEARDEQAAYSWNWTVHEWNPWESSTSKEGKNVTTAELQEAIHYYQHGLQIPRTGSRVTSDFLKELIKVWQGIS